MTSRTEPRVRDVQLPRGRDHDSTVGGVLLSKAPGRPLAALSGVVAAAMVLLAVLAVLAFVLTGARSLQQQPSVGALIVQIVAAALVLGLQRVVDRRRGPVAAACAVAIAAITAAMLWVYWIA